MRNRYILCFFGIGLLFSCQSPRTESEHLAYIQAPPSYLSFSVNFPVNELEEGVNEILPQEILDDRLQLKGKDTLILRVVRSGKLHLTIRENEVFADIPLKVKAAIKKKVLGMTLSNEDAPVTFTGILRTSARVHLADDWNLDMACRYLEFEMEEEPEITILGISVNLEGTLKKILDDNSDNLSNIICGALHQAIDFRKILSGVWVDLQKPQRIAKKPLNLWLYSQPTALNGEFLKNKRDTLAIHLEYRTSVLISSLEQKIPVVTELPDRNKPLNHENVLVLYPELQLPYKHISETLKKVLVAQQFTYEGYRIQIEDVEVGRKGQKLKFIIQTTGDLTGKVIVTGVPALSRNRELILEDFKYEIESKDDWVQMADWAVHQFAEQYVEEKVKLDTKPFFNQLDAVIMQGLTNSKLGPKLAVNLDFKSVDSYQLRLDDDGLQWVYFIEGSAKLHLKKGLFTSKKN